MAHLAAPGLDDAATRTLLDSAANIASVDAGWRLLDFTHNADVSSELRRTAIQRLVANIGPRARGPPWPRTNVLPPRLAALLVDAQLRSTALEAIDELRVESLADAALSLAENKEVAADVRERA